MVGPFEAGDIAKRPRASSLTVALVPFTLFALALPRCLVGFNRRRFPDGVLKARVKLAEQEVRSVFSGSQLVDAGSRDGFARAFLEKSG